MKNYVILALSLFLLIFICGCSCSITTVFMVRHAEKGSGDNPNLTTAGADRAQDLERILHHVPLSAVYTTYTKRTVQTALPTAQDHNLDTIVYATPEIVNKVLQSHQGKKVLVVGHSNSVSQMITAFGGESNPFPTGIDESEFDNLIILSVYKRQTGQSTTAVKSEVIHMKFGQ